MTGPRLAGQVRKVLGKGVRHNYAHVSRLLAASARSDLDEARG